ncbi:helix-turn-helix domain-containing protein [Streptomyces sp. NPDC005374]|uniref:helix-turn-helix domain-containing protein n=1 Tax=Streptomyces sp. NPDC005374 TaxID=3364713 RepID=UPI0036C1B04D
MTQKSEPRTGAGPRTPEANPRGDMKARQKITGLPQLYSAADVAQALGCSEWWVKEQARRGRIPFTKPGGSYRFTAEHFTEIMHIFESRPTESHDALAPTKQAPRRRATTTAASVTSLKARTPRRAQGRQPQSSAA